MICYITMYLYTIFAYSPCTQRNRDALEIASFNCAHSHVVRPGLCASAEAGQYQRPVGSSRLRAEAQTSQHGGLFNIPPKTNSPIKSACGAYKCLSIIMFPIQFAFMGYLIYIYICVYVVYGIPWYT